MTCHVTWQDNPLRVTQPSYKEPPDVRGGTSKPRLGYTNAPKIPRRCCPAEVPPALLSSLKNPPSVFAELADQFSPYLKQLCRSHLQLFAERTSAAFAQRRDDQTCNNATSTALWASPTDRPRRRRTSSLPDISYKPFSKRPRLDVSPRWDFPIHDQMADDIYRRRVLTKLEERLKRTSTLDTHGEATDKLIFDMYNTIPFHPYKKRWHHSFAGDCDLELGRRGRGMPSCS